MRRRLIRFLPLVAIVVGAVTSAAMAMSSSRHASTASQAKTATVDTVKNSKFGTVLIGANGHTLYRFTTDTKNHALCTGGCAVYWKPLLVKVGAKPMAGSGVAGKLLGSIHSAHGTEQVTYAGFPLYMYFQDIRAGQFNGQGASNAQNGIKPPGLWYVVNAHGALVKSGATTASRTSTGAGGGYGGGGY